MNSKSAMSLHGWLPILLRKLRLPPLFPAKKNERHLLWARQVSQSVVLAGTLVLSSTGLGAFGQEVQTPSISTDRPTVGTSPDLVPARSLQFEDGLGATFQRSRFNVDLPESLVRYGISNRLEINFLSSDEVYQPSATPHLSSLQSMDPMLGAKVGWSKANSVLPRSATMGISFPLGGTSWTSGSYDPSIALVWTQTFGRTCFLNEVAGATLTTVADARRPAWAPSIAGGRSFNENFGIFAEYAPTRLANGSSDYVIDGGFAVVHRKLTQFDVRTGYLRDGGGFHTLFSLGYSFRIDAVRR